MEKKLAEYRARKAKEEGYPGKPWFGLNPFKNKTSESPHSKESGIGAAEGIENEASEEMQANANVSFKEPWNRTQLMLTILMWIFAWLFCIEQQFGAVFFVVSMIFFIYYNTRTGRKEKNRLSAYSVFNPNCERIDGTFTSEQFEKELLHGANSVRN